MEFAKYQKLAARTMHGPTDGFSGFGLPVCNALIGVLGEFGEVADLIKKHLWQGHNLALEKVAEELGDTLWYLAMLCTYLGVSLDQIAEDNIAKLRARYPNGFEVERSINREE